MVFEGAVAYFSCKRLTPSTNYSRSEPTSSIKNGLRDKASGQCEA
jgi:hypothetical protein